MRLEQYTVLIDMPGKRVNIVNYCAMCDECLVNSISCAELNELQFPLFKTMIQDCLVCESTHVVPKANECSLCAQGQLFGM